MDSYYVIGSGPAGVAAAVGLTDSGADVTMLDAGFELEQDRVAMVNRLSAMPADRWPNRDIAVLKASMTAHAGGVDQKTVYGSDFCYRGMDRIQPVVLENAKMYRTLAKGGLSNVWGAAIFPFRHEDMKAWPIDPESLAGSYAAVLNFMVHAGGEEGRTGLYPGFSETYQHFRMCRQIQALKGDMDKAVDKLNAQGVFCDQSRLAVDFDRCKYTGMCLYGCPYRLIYNSAYTLEQLRRRSNFRYQPGVLVDRLEERNGRVSIKGTRLESGEALNFVGGKVYLAAGILSSTRILLQSMDAYEHTVRFRHSEHFQIPLVRWKKTPDVDREALHTLTQLSISLVDPSVCPRTVHLQVYAYNDLYDSVMKRLTGPLKGLSAPISREILGRLLIIKGYLHSDVSSHITVRLDRRGRLMCKGIPNADAVRTVRRVYRKLIQLMPVMRALPSPLMAHIGLPGEGNHSGGSFPMVKRPGAFETDALGRPARFQHVHVVDASVMPSIPASTITLTAMANAHRIALASLHNRPA